MSFFGQYYLAVNSRLPSYLQLCTAMHELGHIILHADALRQTGVMQDTQLFRQTVTRENEANLFAAEPGQVQMRVLTTEGEALAGSKVTFKVEDVLNDEVLV